ncbi:MAG: hypothetical protein LBI72_13030 [Flavobacteriaceae bacterium]|jgi:hypothetical protein|nr:hypothetical protein [Flavobacteriaceae bacterium]
MSEEVKKLVFDSVAKHSLLRIRLYGFIIALIQAGFVSWFLIKLLKQANPDILVVICSVSLVIPLLLASIGLFLFALTIGSGLKAQNSDRVNLSFLGLKYYFVMIVVSVIFFCIHVYYWSFVFLMSTENCYK